MISFALLAPVVLGAGAVAVDYTFIYNERAKLQDAADSAALAAAREMTVSGRSKKEITAISENYAHANLSGYQGGGKAEKAPRKQGLSVFTEVLDDNSGVRVDLEYIWRPFLVHYYDKTALPLKSTAIAGLAGNTTICALTLDDDSDGAFEVFGDSELNANGCAVQSNSDSTNAILVDRASKLRAETTCSSGGYGGAQYSFSPIPTTDCPVFEDPLAGRVLPKPSAGCRAKDMLIANKKRSLKPGTFCGGIVILASSEVTLEPGNYIITDGDLDISGNSILKGKNVNLHFAENARMIARNPSTLQLSAPKTGSMAGVLISSGPKNKARLTFEIQSQDAKQLTGLIYLPNNPLLIGDDEDNDDVCDTDDDIYRGKHSKKHKHEHSHEDGTVHTHHHFQAIVGYRLNKFGAPYHGDDDHSHDQDLPNCEVEVGQSSDWTAIIAKTLKVTAGVKLTLNSDHGSSPIPLPVSNGSMGKEVRLSR